MRDFTYDEDRCRAYVRYLPRNLACLTNAAIAIVRCQGTFRYLPQGQPALSRAGEGGPRHNPEPAYRLTGATAQPDTPQHGAGQETPVPAEPKNAVHGPRTLPSWCRSATSMTRTPSEYLVSS